YADRLDDRSALAVMARRSAALRRYTQLLAIDPESFEGEDALTYGVLRDQFANVAAGAAFNYGDFSPLGGVRPYVLNQMDSAFLTLPVFLDERHDIADAASAEAFLTRLRLVADAIDAETERARADAAIGVRPPVFIIDTVAVLVENVLRTPLAEQVYIASLRRKLDAMAAAQSEPQR